MTNEQAKQEAIKEAWREFGFTVNENIISDNAWRRIKPSQYSSKYENLDLLKLTNHVHSIRPKSLNGIEDNNGWIRIEPDGSNLPIKHSEIKSYKIGKLENGVFHIFSYEVQTDWLSVHSKSGNVTHYKPITPELKPIY